MRNNLKHCIICKKPLDDTFWDKGNYGTERYLCTKTCYDAWLVKWQANCIRGTAQHNRYRLNNREEYNCKARERARNKKLKSAIL